MLTFKDLQDRVLFWIDEAGDTSTTLQNVKDAINRVHRTICLGENWPWMMWPREESFTTRNGIKSYALNRSLGKLRTLWDVEANDFAIVLPRRQWEIEGVDRGSASRTPRSWVFGPVWPVAGQPEYEVGSPSAITIVSDNALDVNGPGVFIVGIDDSFSEVTENMVATGMTPVTSVQPFAQILSVTKTGTWTGTLVIKDANANILLNVDSDVDGYAYPTIESTENPTAGRRYTYTFLRKPRELVRDGDIPEIHPNDLSEILVYATLLELTTYNTELGMKEQIQWKGQYDRLYALLEQSMDEGIVGSFPRTVREVDMRNRVRIVMDN